MFWFFSLSSSILESSDFHPRSSVLLFSLIASFIIIIQSCCMRDIAELSDVDTFRFYLISISLREIVKVIPDVSRDKTRPT